MTEDNPFDLFACSGSGVISKKELKLFYTAFLDAGRLGDKKLSELTEVSYSAMTSNGDVQLSFHMYKLSFLNFLLGKQPNGPGQFMFGIMEAEEDVPSLFPIDYTALQLSKEEVEEQERKREEHLSRGESARETKTEIVDTARRGTGTIKESASPSRERRRSVLV